jgi:Transmembrane domain of unknown function (DUF3566)
MSAREGSSDTWPRYVPFPADNLDGAGTPEEDDVDHRGDAPSWLPGAGAVTGADPPDLDASDDEQHGGGPVYAAGPDDSDAPGFSDRPMGGASHENGAAQGAPPDFGDTGAPGFNGGQPEPSVFGEAPGFNGGQPEPSAFGDAPAFGGTPDGEHEAYSPPPGADVFGNAGASAFGGADDPGQGYSAQPQGFGENHGYTEGQQGPYVGPVTGEFRGDYESGYSGSADPMMGAAEAGAVGGASPGAAFGSADAGYGAAAGGDYGVAQDGGMSGAGGVGMGTMYRDQGYQVGQENGARPMDQSTAYQSQYPPVEPPRSRMTASLRSVKRRGFGTGRRNDPQGRQAQLTVGRIEPWSVMKFSFVISLVAFIVLFVAVAVLYAALSGLGVFSALQHSVENITSSQGSSGFNLMTYLSASRVLGYTGLLGAINVVLITALCTVGSVLYNLTANLAGGVEITLKESD